MHRTSWICACALVAALAAATPASASTTLDYTTPHDEVLQPFGNPDTQTYGQTLTVPAGESYLRRIGFEVALPADLPFRAEVYAWDPVAQHPTGPSLYESPTTTTPDASNTVPVSFDTGGVRVTPGGQYVIALTTARDAGPQETGALAVNSSNPYSGGEFVYANSDGDAFAQVVGRPWNDQGELSDYDAAFSATFAPPPLVAGQGTLGKASFRIDVEGPQASPSGSASVTYAGQTASGTVTCARIVAANRAVFGVKGSDGRYYEFSAEDSRSGDRIGSLGRSTTPPPTGCRSKTPPAGSGTRISSGDVTVTPSV